MMASPSETLQFNCPRARAPVKGAARTALHPIKAVLGFWFQPIRDSATSSGSSDHYQAPPQPIRQQCVFASTCRITAQLQIPIKSTIQFFLIRSQIFEPYPVALRHRMDDYLISACVTTLVVSFIGALIAKLFGPSTYLIYAQSFACGSLLGIAILHFIPEAVRCFQGHDPYYTLIIVSVVFLFSVAEVATKPPPTEARFELTDSTPDFALFLMHHFTGVPSATLQCVVYICFLAHSVIIAFAIYFQHHRHQAFTVPLLIVVLVEKFIESFSLTLILGALPNQVWFWLLITLYSVATPITIIVADSQQIAGNLILTGVFMAISAGVFIFIGVMLWRRTFHTPYDWRKEELVIVCLALVAGMAIQALTRIPEKL
jgi:zinc transporter ZupT